MSYSGGSFEFDFPFVFICHDSNDMLLVEQLADMLDKHNIDVIDDYHVMQGGNSKEEKIELLIKNSSSLLCVLCESSNNYCWCQKGYENTINRCINEGNINVIVIVFGNLDIPKILEDKYQIKMSLDEKGQIVCDENNWTEMISLIKEQTVDGMLGKLITQNIESKKADTEWDVYNNQTSNICLVIQSMLKDFPVESLTKDNIDTRFKTAIYRQVNLFVDEFTNLTNQLLEILRVSYKELHLNDKQLINQHCQKLHQIKTRMQNLSESLKKLTGVNKNLTSRLSAISNICIEIYNCENMQLEIWLGLDNIMDHRSIPDTMEIEKFSERKDTYSFTSFSFISIEQLEFLLQHINNYRDNLREVINRYQ